MASNVFKLRIQFFLLWSVLITVTWMAFSAPIVLHRIDFPYWVQHSAFIVIFLLCIRYVFFLRHSFLASSQIAKVVCFFLCIWGTFILIHQVNDFKTDYDDTGLQSFLGHLSDTDYKWMRNFIRKEMIFFGVASIISTVILGFRMILGIWRWHNHGNV